MTRRPAPQPRNLVTVDLMQSTAYAVRGERTVLVDTGPAGQEDRLLRRLAKAGVQPADISLIVLTHCHPDHAGGAAELRQRLGVPVAVHAEEADWAASGRSDFYQVQRPFGHLLRRLMRPTFPAFPPDIVLEHGAALDEHGAPLTVLHTPGHTPGSVTLLHRPGRDALVGDLLAGGMLRRNRPAAPFFAQDPGQLDTSLHTVLAQGPDRLLFGHGRPATAESAHRRLGRITRR
ncbi:MBL fold metallo-hydrolase [Streptomyces aidingensis]|uniref:Glyoxylase, beta-lactamase superfamily II n=1 Tax=Streptomyces aidingensis TaxID=910347 RepID=A0A1I1H591_9ACTN|nr:MBL fold metallo-hydrolase [Streptomyces aidingensis]SFC19339.1 Glyoxylase, beta-lactamase superfamily II [Streptomyces aidingensis]